MVRIAELGAAVCDVNEESFAIPKMGKDVSAGDRFREVLSPASYSRVPSTDMNAWKVVYRLTAFVNFVLCAVGAYWMILSLVSVIERHPFDAATRYFPIVFGIMTTFNIFFISALVFGSVKLIRFAPNAARFYCTLVGAYLVYSVLNGTLWLAPDPWGTSIARATGIGNMGLAPFALFLFPIRDWMIPSAYPIVSAVAVFIAGKKLRKFSVESIAA
jgi:hypothetical protein